MSFFINSYLAVSISKRHRGESARSHFSFTGAPTISPTKASANWQTSGCSATAAASGQFPLLINNLPFSFSSRAAPPSAANTPSAFRARLSKVVFFLDEFRAAKERPTSRNTSLRAFGARRPLRTVMSSLSRESYALGKRWSASDVNSYAK